MAQRFKAKTLLSNSGVFYNEVIAPNLVYNTGNQTISGVKTFSAPHYEPGEPSLGISIYPSGQGSIVGPLIKSNEDLTIAGSNTAQKIIFSDESTVIRAGTANIEVSTAGNGEIYLNTNDGSINLNSQTVGKTGTFEKLYADNLVYNTGNQTINGVKTFSDGFILDGGITGTNLVYNTGNQTISGVKEFASRPTVNQTGVLLSGELAAEFKFTGDLDVSLIGTKTFGRYSNGQRIPASGKTVPQVFELILTEPIPPTVSLTSSTVIPYNQISINNILNASNVINSLNSFVDTGVIEFRRGDVGSYTKLTGNQSSSFVYTHSLTDTAFNANAFNYRYIVSGTKGETSTQTLTITPSFFYRNYLGYSSNTTLTFPQLEALSNSVLSDSKVRTVSSVTPGAGNYIYYCYRASEGNLTSISDGLEQFIGAFTKLTDVVGVNSNGVSVTYAVYKSNSTNAFANTTLIFN